MLLVLQPTQIEAAKLVGWEILGDPEGLDEKYEGDLEDNPLFGYSKREFMVLQKTNVKLARMLAKTEHRFRLYFLLDYDAGFELDDEPEGPINYSRLVKYLEEAGIDPPEKDSTSINIVMRGLGGALVEKENLPPTPWIIVHWIAHAVSKDSDGYNRAGHWMYRNLKDTVNDVIDGVYGTRGLDQSKEFLEKLFQFRSARKRQVRNFYEALHDAFTEYLTTGDIRVGDMPLSIKQHPLHGEDPPRRPKKGSMDEIYLNGVVEDMVDEFKAVFEQRLDSAEGKWYVV